MSSRNVLTIYDYIEVEDSYELDNIEIISCILDGLNINNKIFLKSKNKNNLYKNS